MKEPRIHSIVRCETPTGTIVGKVVAIPEDGSFYVIETLATGMRTISRERFADYGEILEE